MQKKDAYVQKRQEIVTHQIKAKGINNPALLKALESVPRHLFVSENLRDKAYDPHPLSIGCDQTISQPFIVAYMIQEARITPQSRVLEIGTGSGYNAAVLSLLCQDVYTIEIYPLLSQRASAILQELNYTNIHFKVGDGSQGCPEAAPFDVIISTAASHHVPLAWQTQLKEGGRIILPLHQNGEQMLVRLTKTSTGFDREDLLPVQFVPFLSQVAQAPRLH